MGQGNSRYTKEEEKFMRKFNKVVINKINDTNGLILQGQPIPEELLVKILESLDFKSLVKCRIICKLWYVIIQDIIIKKRILNMWNNPPVDEQLLWRYFKTIWGHTIPYGEDLIKYQRKRWNFCREGIRVGSWKNIHDMGEYSTHYLLVDSVIWKEQDIDLYEWFPQYILETIKPTMIKIWDFYWCPKDKCGKYECKIELVKSGPSPSGKKDVILDSCSFSKTFEKESERNEWHKLKRQFVIYENGFDKIKFYHDFRHGVQVGGTTVIVQFPCRRKLKKFIPYKIDFLGRRIKQ